MSEDPTLAQLEVLDALIDTLSSLMLDTLLMNHPTHSRGQGQIIDYWLEDNRSVANLIIYLKADQFDQ